MKIRQIDIIPLNIELSEPFEISLETVIDAQNVFIKIYADAYVGYGESSPFQSILGESQSGQVVIAQLLANTLLSKSPLDIDQRILDMDQIIFGNHGIKSAFDMALYDLIAKVQEVPLYKIFADVEPKALDTDMTIGMQPTDEMIANAEKYVLAGFDAIKVKVGKNYKEDIKRIEGIRQVIGPDVHLRIDANQGWSLDHGKLALNGMIDYNVEHCEEPVASWNLKAQQILTNESPIPIMADESLFDHLDAQRLIDFRACSQFNIKLAKSGGMHKARKIIALSKTNNIPCQVGCFSETRLGITALAHLSIAYDQIVHYDMDSPLMLVDDPILGGITYFKEKNIKINDEPGLGASLDLSYIDSNQIITIR